MSQTPGAIPMPEDVDIAAQITAFRQRLCLRTSPWRSSDANWILALFRLQAAHNPTYANYLKHMECTPSHIKRVADIPYLPIAFFRDHVVKTGNWTTARRFLSSGTTNDLRSAHDLDALSFYNDHAIRIFEHHYGPLSQVSLMTWAPHYHSDSSLLCILDALLNRADATSCQVNHKAAIEPMLKKWLRVTHGKKKILFTSARALYEMTAETGYSGLDLSELIVIETGGLKGKQTETFSKEALHQRLQNRLGVTQIHSEYGMTELLSQAYGVGARLVPNCGLSVRVRDLTDPLAEVPDGEIGGLDVMDLANAHSCCFVQTQDAGLRHADGSFEIIGRMTGAPSRGCHMLYEKF